MDANKTHRAIWKLLKNTMSYFELILEATRHVTTFARPLTSHFAKHTSKTNKTNWRSKGELIRDIIQ